MKTGYMCSTDYDDENMEANIFGNLAILEANRICVQSGSCKIYKVEIKKMRVVKKGKV